MELEAKNNTQERAAGKLMKEKVKQKEKKKVTNKSVCVLFPGQVMSQNPGVSYLCSWAELLTRSRLADRV